jgi:hypothetical protein
MNVVIGYLELTQYTIKSHQHRENRPGFNFRVLRKFIYFGSFSSTYGYMIFYLFVYYLLQNKVHEIILVLFYYQDSVQ